MARQCTNSNRANMEITILKRAGNERCLAFAAFSEASLIEETPPQPIFRIATLLQKVRGFRALKQFLYAVNNLFILSPPGEAGEPGEPI